MVVTLDTDDFFDQIGGAVDIGSPAGLHDGKRVALIRDDEAEARQDRFLLRR